MTGAAFAVLVVNGKAGLPNAGAARKNAMPRQNRVTPFGAVIATPERGTFFGNRGVLHDAEGKLCWSWQVKRWLVCVPEFRGRRRPLADPGRYTALFFLDEATALAAGHRPCFECRRPRFHAFRRAWVQGNPAVAQGREPTAEAIDDRLHAERLGPDGAKRTAEKGSAAHKPGAPATGPPLRHRANGSHRAVQRCVLAGAFFTFSSSLRQAAAWSGRPVASFSCTSHPSASGSRRRAV